jgi:hypothetical protein
MPQEEYKTTENPISKPLQSVSLLRQEVTATMEAVSKIADRGSSHVLLGLGTALVLLPFMFKTIPQFYGHGGLTAAEFITSIIVSMILLLAGSGMRLYQFSKEHDAGKRVRESGVELITKAMDAGVELAKHERPAPPVNV